MTGALQLHARKYSIAIDSLNFEFRVLRGAYKPSDVEQRPEDGFVPISLHGSP